MIDLRQIDHYPNWIAAYHHHEAEDADPLRAVARVLAMVVADLPAPKPKCPACKKAELPHGMAKCHMCREGEFRAARAYQQAVTADTRPAMRRKGGFYRDNE